MFSDPFGLMACPGIEGTDQNSLDDCPAFTPEYYAAQNAKGQGNKAVNEVMGVVTTMGRTLAEHVGATATVGNKDYNTDGYGIAGLLTNRPRQTEVETDDAIDVPKLGASLNVTAGDTKASGGDYSAVVGIKELLSLAFMFSSSGDLKSVTLSVGVTTPALPASATHTP